MFPSGGIPLSLQPGLSLDGQPWEGCWACPHATCAPLDPAHFRPWPVGRQSCWGWEKLPRPAYRQGLHPNSTSISHKLLGLHQSCSPVSSKTQQHHIGDQVATGCPTPSNRKADPWEPLRAAPHPVPAPRDAIPTATHIPAVKNCCVGGVASCLLTNFTFTQFTGPEILS